MLSSVKEYLKPNTLEEAFNMAQGDNAIYVSGGLMVAQLKSSRLEKLVDLKNIGLDGIEEYDKYVKVGANAKLSSFMSHPILSTMYDGFFYNLMKDVGSTQIRNMATVGGSVAFRLGWSDVITALMALKTEVEIFDGKSRKLSMDEYLNMRRGKEIVTAVYIPKENNRFASFEKFSKSTFDIAIINVGMTLKIENDKIADAIVAVGSRPMISSRIREVEEFLKGKDFSSMEDAAEKMKEAVRVGNDIRATAEYRKALAGSLLKKCMRRIENESNV